jgi:hypothetical protein
VVVQELLASSERLEIEAHGCDVLSELHVGRSSHAAALYERDINR